MFKKIVIILSVILTASILFSCSNTNAGDNGDSSYSSISDTGSLQSGDDPIEPSDDHYFVEFNTLGGTETETQKIEKGGKVTKPADPVKYGNEKKQYVFLGWYLGEEEYDFTTVVNDNFTLVAKWDEIVWSDDIGKR